jgi:hypothetical protein
VKKRALLIAGIVLAILAMSVLLTSCWSSPGLQKAYNQNNTQLQKLEANEPAPTISYSNDRAEIASRLTTWNDPNKIGYVYLIDYGKVMAFYTIKGMVVSTNSYDTPMTAPLDSNDSQSSVVDLPDLDGTYGSNPNSIFFYTTSGVYVEWQGDYMLTDQPMQLVTPPELIMNAGSATSTPAK